MNKVSIIVPVYNSEKNLEKCVSSVLSQTYQNIELVLVDDGSYDNSKEMCDGYCTMYSNIKCIHKKNEGVSSARNAGIDISHGDYVLFLDSDDYIDKEAVSIMVEKAVESNSNIVICGYNTIYGQTINSYIPLNTGLFDENTFPRVFFDLWEKAIANCIGTKLYSMQLIRQNKIYFSKYDICEDISFFISAASVCKSFDIIDNKLYYYITDNGSSLMHKYKQNYLQASLGLINLINNYYQKHDIQQYKNDIICEWQRMVLSVIINSSKSNYSIFKNECKELRNNPNTASLNVNCKFSWKARFIYKLFFYKFFIVLFVCLKIVEKEK